MDIKELQKKILKFRDDRDWKQFHNPKDIAVAISIESSELQEHFLWKSQNESYNIWLKPEVAEELADIVIYSILFADSCNIDISKTILDKLEKNGKKYPVDKAKWKNDKYDKI